MLSEVDVELEALALVVMQRLLQERLNLGVEATHVGLGLEVLDGLDVGDGPLATSLGEERDVVTASLVAARAAQVEQPHGAFVTALRFRDIATRGQHGRVRNVEPLLILVGDDDRFHSTTSDMPSLTHALNRTLRDRLAATGTLAGTRGRHNRNQAHVRVRLAPTASDADETLECLGPERCRKANRVLQEIERDQDVGADNVRRLKRGLRRPFRLNHRNSDSGALQHQFVIPPIANRHDRLRSQANDVVSLCFGLPDLVKHDYLDRSMGELLRDGAERVRGDDVNLHEMRQVVQHHCHAGDQNPVLGQSSVEIEDEVFETQLAEPGYVDDYHQRTTVTVQLAWDRTRFETEPVSQRVNVFFSRCPIRCSTPKADPRGRESARVLRLWRLDDRQHVHATLGGITGPTSTPAVATARRRPETENSEPSLRSLRLARSQRRT